MKKKSGITAFLVGAAIGSVASLLYAPRSGEETRRLLEENSQEMKDKALSAIQEAQESAQIAIEKSQKRVETLTREANIQFTKIRDLSIDAEIVDDNNSAVEKAETEEIPEPTSV
jgi:gas vesicle protein